MLDQIINKALLIPKSLYSGYELLFMFDNVTSHSIYAKNEWQVAYINKEPGGQHLFFRVGWYTDPNRELIIQDMSITNINSTNGTSITVQKKIQAILVGRKLWPSGGVRLVYDTLKCTTCEAFSTRGICVRSRKCNSCKEAKNCSGKCIKLRICEISPLWKEHCECLWKKYCARCKEINVQKFYYECEKIPPKCNLESESFITENIYLLDLFGLLCLMNSFNTIRFFFIKVCNWRKNNGYKKAYTG